MFTPSDAARARIVGITVLAGLLQAAGATRAGSDGAVAQQGEPLTFAAAVDLILVDAVVTDGQGRIVTGLTADDFVVREDGEPQTLTSFEAVDLPPVAPKPRASAVPARSSSNDGEAESRRRVFLVVMDDTGLGLQGAIAARKAAKQFLSEAKRPGDLVTIVVPGSGLTWSDQLPEGEARLASVLDSVEGRRAAAPELAGDFEALQIVQGTDARAQDSARVRLDSAGQLSQAARSFGESDQAYEQRNREFQQPSLMADARRQLDHDRERRQRLFVGVSSALEAVASIKGRKSVLLFSEGFIREPNDPPLRDLVASLRRNNASIYYVDVQRLTSGAAADSRQPGDRSASTRLANPQESAGAEVVAEETGGFTVHGSGELESGLRRVAEEASSYYLLGYSPPNSRRDGKYRRLQVELRRADLKVRARRGYYGPSSEKPVPLLGGKRRADPVLESALESAVPAREIPLRLAAFAMQPLDKGKARVRLVAEVSLKPLRFETDADGARVATLDVALALNHVMAGGRQRTPWRELKVKVPSAAEGVEIWTSIEASFDVPAGACQARLAVRDRGSQAVGSVRHDFAVPEPASWRVSTPILSDVPGEERDRPPRMLVHRSFVAGSPLYCYLELYDGAKKKGAEVPRASLAYTLVDASGKARKSQPASPFAVGTSGIATRLEAIPLSGLAPGGYELRLVVRDDVSGRSEELREPFLVRRPNRPDVATYRELIEAYRAGDVERAAAGVLEWRPKDLEKLAAALPREDVGERRAALQLHTGLAFRLWSHARALEAEAQIGLGRAVLGKDPPPDLHRDWLLDVGYYHLAAASPAKALPFFEESQRLFPDAASAWLGAGMSHEFTAFPGGFIFAARPSQDAAGNAERCYREAARLDPRLAEARLRLGRVLALTGAIEEAEKELAAAAETSNDGPVKALAHVFWGGVRDAKGDLAGAEGHYEAALAADRESQTAAFALSEVLYRSGHHREAAEQLALALTPAQSTEISPWHAYHLGPGRRRPGPSTPDALGSDVAGSEP